MSIGPVFVSQRIPMIYPAINRFPGISHSPWIKIPYRNITAFRLGIVKGLDHDFAPGLCHLRVFCESGMDTVCCPVFWYRTCGDCLIELWLEGTCSLCDFESQQHQFHEPTDFLSNRITTNWCPVHWGRINKFSLARPYYIMPTAKCDPSPWDWTQYGSETLPESGILL